MKYSLCMNFNFFIFFDRYLQRINELVRNHHLWESEKMELKELIKMHCQFVNDCSSPVISSDMLHVFGKRSAVTDSERKVLGRMGQCGTVIHYRQ